MFWAYLRRGLQAGLVAGLALGLFVALVANPAIGLSEELAGEHGAADHGGETHADHGEGGHGASEGLLGHASAAAVSVLGGVLLGVLFGVVVFGIGFYFLEPGIPGQGVTKSLLLGAAGFLTVSGAPWLVLPPQPPGVEQGLGTDARLLWYGGMMLAGALACGLAGYAYQRGRSRGRAGALTVAALPFSGLLGVAALAPANPVTYAIPDALVFTFQGLVAMSQLAVWLVLAVTHLLLYRRDDAASSLTPDGLDGQLAGD